MKEKIRNILIGWLFPKGIPKEECCKPTIIINEHKHDWSEEKQWSGSDGVVFRSRICKDCKEFERKSL